MSEQEERRRLGNRRNRRKRMPPKPNVVLSVPETTAPESTQRVAEMGIAPSREKERPKYEPTDEHNDAVETVTMEVLEAMDIDCEVDFEHGPFHRVDVTIDSGGAGALIGRRGASIEALELLLSRMASQKIGGMIPMQVDVNEYRTRKEEELKEEAAELAKRVLQTGEDFHLPPMNARERRIVHITVKPNEGLETFTVGEGARRHVVICKIDGGDDAGGSDEEQ